MSCTVVAVPYALAWVIGTMVAASSAAIGNMVDEMDYISDRTEDLVKETNYSNDCDDVQVITDKHFIEKDFETPFVDNEILKKTLEEHGVRNINENGFNITGQVDNYSLSFQKSAMDEPYKLRISCLNSDKPEEKIEDLSSEYAMNVQEDAYLHIMEKLKDNNMQVESEEVQEDNTIVLTVNID